MCVIPEHAKGKVTNTKRKHGLSGRCPDAVNVNIGPVEPMRLRESDTMN